MGKQNKLAQNHQLTNNEKRLRGQLMMMPGGSELWTIVKAGFSRSYYLGSKDAWVGSKEELLAAARQRILEWCEFEEGRAYEDAVISLLVDVFNDDYETIRSKLFANRPEFFNDTEKTSESGANVFADPRTTTVRFAHDTSSEWKSTAEYNLMFLRQLIHYLSDVLKKRGLLCLNDVLLELGMDIEKEGYSVIWSAEDGDTLEIVIESQVGDSYLDLRIGAREKQKLTQTNAPVAMVALLGHPNNEHHVVKQADGRWRSLHTGDIIDDEDFRAGWMPYFVDLENFLPWEE